MTTIYHSSHARKSLYNAAMADRSNRLTSKMIMVDCLPKTDFSDINPGLLPQAWLENSHSMESNNESTSSHEGSDELSNFFSRVGQNIPHEGRQRICELYVDYHTQQTQEKKTEDICDIGANIHNVLQEYLEPSTLQQAAETYQTRATAARSTLPRHVSCSENTSRSCTTSHCSRRRLSTGDQLKISSGNPNRPTSGKDSLLTLLQSDNITSGTDLSNIDLWKTKPLTQEKASTSKEQCVAKVENSVSLPGAFWTTACGSSSQPSTQGSCHPHGLSQEVAAVPTIITGVAPRTGMLSAHLATNADIKPFDISNLSLSNSIDDGPQTHTQSVDALREYLHSEAERYEQEELRQLRQCHQASPDSGIVNPVSIFTSVSTFRSDNSHILSTDSCCNSISPSSMDFSLNLMDIDDTLNAVLPSSRGDGINDVLIPNEDHLRQNSTNSALQNDLTSGGSVKLNEKTSCHLDDMNILDILTSSEEWLPKANENVMQQPLMVTSSQNSYQPQNSFMFVSNHETYPSSSPQIFNGSLSGQYALAKCAFSLPQAPPIFGKSGFRRYSQPVHLDGSFMNGISLSQSSSYGNSLEQLRFNPAPTHTVPLLIDGTLHSNVYQIQPFAVNSSLLYARPGNGEAVAPANNIGRSPTTSHLQEISAGRIIKADRHAHKKRRKSVGYLMGSERPNGHKDRLHGHPFNQLSSHAHSQTCSTSNTNVVKGRSECGSILAGLLES